MSRAPLPRLQFVSKPMAPPFRDGSKCLVRDLCLHLTTVEPHLMGTGEPAPELEGHAVFHKVYSASGGYSPSLLQNLRAALFLGIRGHTDLWHFVFAPNPRSSQVAAALRKARRIPTVQTIASPPRSFETARQLLFGDAVVAQSEWTRSRFQAALEGSGSPRIFQVIPPPAPEVSPPSENRIEAERTRLEVEQDAVLFLYPGDLEVSRGADRVIDWAPELRTRVPGARVVVAYRQKTSSADGRARELSERADLGVVRFERNVPDIHALVAASTAVVFPVDDLYGKVDLPIILLEALRLGTPVIALDEGPLQSLEGAVRLPSEGGRWLELMSRMALDSEYRANCVATGRNAVKEHYEPATVARKYEAIYAQLLGAS